MSTPQLFVVLDVDVSSAFSSSNGVVDVPVTVSVSANPGCGCEARRRAIVAYEPGAAREEWCTDGHRGYVVEGQIVYEFDDGSEPLSLAGGQGFYLAAGTRHRGSNPGGSTTRLFLIDDPL